MFNKYLNYDYMKSWYTDDNHDIHDIYFMIGGGQE